MDLILQRAEHLSLIQQNCMMLLSLGALRDRNPEGDPWPRRWLRGEESAELLSLMLKVFVLQHLPGNHVPCLKQEHPLHLYLAGRGGNRVFSLAVKREALVRSRLTQERFWYRHDTHFVSAVRLGKETMPLLPTQGIYKRSVFSQAIFLLVKL